MKSHDNEILGSGQASQPPSLAHPNATEASRRALRHLLDLQRPNGDWEGEMVWCTMILAQAVIVRTAVDHPYTAEEKRLIVRHFQSAQREDGSWGMHPESPGYVFFTTLAYIALRLLDMPADAPMLVSARQWLQGQSGGVTGIPSWGKFWLAMLGLYEYDGINALPPEIFLLPEWLPFHPRRYYCHTRQIYLGLAFLYGMRFRAPLPDSIRDALRQELYQQSYATIDFPSLRNAVAACDLYVPISPLLRLVYTLLGTYERWHSTALRKKALDQCFERILYEQRTTRYQGISPVSSLLNCLALFARDPHHPDLLPSIEGIEAWRWEDEAEGLRYVGARSNTWDTAFVVQALLEAQTPVEGAHAALGRAHVFLKGAQLTEELPDYRTAWRDPARGGWCFSDGQHRWPVSDCTAEALSALLTLSGDPEFGVATPLDDEKLRQAVRFILSRQNADGGFGTYERRRAGKLLEMVNPSEMFGQCMTELSYIECTASALAAFAHYRKHHPDLPDGQIDRATVRALAFLRRSQHKDGSYPGFWGINYTYAIYHVVKGFRLTGVPSTDGALQATARWLVSTQRSDGGWGEHYSGCLENRYVEHVQSQVVMTSWALLALLEILPPDDESITRGIEWLVSHQLQDGGWPRQGVNGVFFGAAMLDYRLYHIYFPTWALARYVRLVGVANNEYQDIKDARRDA